MTYKKLFIDSDILLDMLLNRNPFYFHTQILLLEHSKGNIQLNTSALVIANVNYVLSKHVGSELSRKKIKELIKVLNILPLEGDVIDLALSSNFSDFEDAIQNLIAGRYKCEVIITRNIKDYKQSNLPVFTPEQFLNTL